MGHSGAAVFLRSRLGFFGRSGEHDPQGLPEEPHHHSCDREARRAHENPKDLQCVRWDWCSASIPLTGNPGRHGPVRAVNHRVGPWIPRETFEQGSHDGESFPLKLTVAAPALAKLRCP